MKKVRVEDAVGMTLCHDLTEMKNGFKGTAFRRGHVITEADIPHMLDIGKQHVYIWEEGKGEIHEEDAARRLAALMSLAGTHQEGPSEGKILIISDASGMLRVNVPLLSRLNRIGDITVSTLPDHYPVEPGMRLASMRIVPLVTQESQIIEAEKLCRGEKVLDLLPYRSRRAGVIITGAEVYSGRIKDLFEPVCRSKLARYPGEIVGVALCDDKLGMLVTAARDMLNKGADFLIFSGGMSVDPDDLTPAAIRELGCEVVSYGVPSQPGNMTLMAYLRAGVLPSGAQAGGQARAERLNASLSFNESSGDIPVIGVPGAAITMPTTIFDVLLPQIYTGVPLTEDDLVRLGDGGLCQQCRPCHFPNCTFGRY